jgi:hypothetical protein
MFCFPCDERVRRLDFVGAFGGAVRACVLRVGEACDRECECERGEEDFLFHKVLRKIEEEDLQRIHASDGDFEFHCDIVGDERWIIPIAIADFEIESFQNEFTARGGNACGLCDGNRHDNVA